jgi:hypothetical protein
MVNLSQNILTTDEQCSIRCVPPDESTDAVVSKWSEHQWWDFGQGGKNLLNNLRLVMQPYQFFNLLKPWVRVFPITHLSVGFLTLISLMNRMRGAIPESTESEYFLFSSA